MRPDGTQQANMTMNPATDDWPWWNTGGPYASQGLSFNTDRDGNHELYVMDAFGQHLIRSTNDPAADFQGVRGSDVQGTPYILWVSDRDGDNEIYSDPSAPTNLTNNPASDTAPALSPEATAFAFQSDRDGNSELYFMGSGGSGATRLTNNPAFDGAPSWSPTGNRIAFESNRDGNFEIYIVNADGTGLTRLTTNPAGDRQPVWSPDGTKIAFQTNRDGNFEIYTMDVDGTDPVRLTSNPGLDVNADWRSALGAGHPRPKGATPLRVSLVPRLEPCTTPNRMHGPPLEFPSCTPPQLVSDRITVGIPEISAGAAQFSGFVRLVVVPGNPGPPEDSNVLIEATLVDLRCQPAGAPCGNVNAAGGPDYTGELEGRLEIRLTDRVPNTGGPPQESTTTTDFPFPFTVGCASTASANEGGTCSVSTSANSVIPGSVQDAKRAIWQLGQVTVTDGGADGLASTQDNEVFAAQGVFNP
jgi:hypothetical protein